MSKLRLIAELGLDKTGFDAGMAAAGKQVNRFGTDLKSMLAGGFAATTFAALTREAIELADSISELAERLGVGNQEAQEFSMAARLGGADVDFFAKKFERLRAVLQEAKASGKNPLEAFGIGFTDDPTRAVRELARVIEQTGLSATQSAKFVELFGVGAGKMINVLGDLRNANKGTLFFTDSDIEQLKEADDIFTKISNNVKVIVGKLLNPRYGALTLLLAKLGIDPLGINQSGKERPPIDEEEIDKAEKQARIKELVQQRILRLEEETFNLRQRNLRATISDEQRLNELAKEREGIFKRSAKTDEERAMKERDLARNEGDIIALSKTEVARKPDDDITKGSHKFSVTETAFGRIGAFTGAAATASLPPLMQQQINHLQALRDAMINRGIAVRDVR